MFTKFCGILELQKQDPSFNTRAGAAALASSQAFKNGPHRKENLT